VTQLQVGGARFVGQRVARKEDARFLTGHGQYVDDIALPGVLHAAFVRSDLARGRIVSIDTTEAAAMPGVHAVYVAWFRVPQPDNALAGADALAENRDSPIP